MFLIASFSKYNVNLRYKGLPCAIDRRIGRVDGQSRKVPSEFLCGCIDCYFR